MKDIMKVSLRDNVRLSINESLPFPVKYHLENEGSACTVKQEDLEGLYKAYRKSFKFGVISFFFATLSVLSLVYVVCTQTVETKLVFVQDVHSD